MLYPFISVTLNFLYNWVNFAIIGFVILTRVLCCSPHSTATNVILVLSYSLTAHEARRYNKACNAKVLSIFSPVCLNTRIGTDKKTYFTLYTFYTHPLLDGTVQQHETENVLVSPLLLCVSYYTPFSLHYPISNSFLIESYYTIPHLSPDLYSPISTASYPASVAFQCSFILFFVLLLPDARCAVGCRQKQCYPRTCYN
jgi:hypothetical protein